MYVLNVFLRCHKLFNLCFRAVRFAGRTNKKRETAYSLSSVLYLNKKYILPCKRLQIGQRL